MEMTEKVYYDYSKAIEMFQNDVQNEIKIWFENEKNTKLDILLQEIKNINLPNDRFNKLLKEIDKSYEDECDNIYIKISEDTHKNIIYFRIHGFDDGSDSIISMNKKITNTTWVRSENTYKYPFLREYLMNPFLI